jgi:hypothetical protein
MDARQRYAGRLGAGGWTRHVEAKVRPDRLWGIGHDETRANFLKN